MHQHPMPFQTPEPALAHSWGDRLREAGETIGALVIVLGLFVRLGIVHVDRLVTGWFKRNKDVAKAQVVALLDEQLRPLRDIPAALEDVARATRANARATRAHTRSMSSLSDRVARTETAIARLDERTKHLTPES